MMRPILVLGIPGLATVAVAKALAKTLGEGAPLDLAESNDNSDTASSVRYFVEPERRADTLLSLPNQIEFLRKHAIVVCWRDAIDYLSARVRSEGYDRLGTIMQRYFNSAIALIELQPLIHDHVIIINHRDLVTRPDWLAGQLASFIAIRPQQQAILAAELRHYTRPSTSFDPTADPLSLDQLSFTLEEKALVAETLSIMEPDSRAIAVALSAARRKETLDLTKAANCSRGLHVDNLGNTLGRVNAEGQRRLVLRVSGTSSGDSGFVFKALPLLGRRLFSTTISAGGDGSGVISAKVECVETRTGSPVFVHNAKIELGQMLRLKFEVVPEVRFVDIAFWASQDNTNVGELWIEKPRFQAAS